MFDAREGGGSTCVGGQWVMRSPELTISIPEDYIPFNEPCRARCEIADVDAPPRPASRQVRADAQRNRERLLEAAIELILEVGGEPTRDALAERAGVGIGTVYRHFPDRQSLLQAVARHALERSITAGEEALAETAGGNSALRQYMHAAVDNGIGVVNLLYPLLDTPEWPELRARAASLLTTMIEREHRSGRIRDDAIAADIVFATIRFGRPLSIGQTADEERAIAHRHIDIYLDGLLSAAVPEGSRSV